MDNFYSSLNYIFDKNNPQKILYIGKIFGEYYMNDKRINHFQNSNLDITNYIIKEPTLIKYKNENFFEKIIGKYDYLTFEEFFKKELDNDYDLIFMDTVQYKEETNKIIKNIVTKGKLIILHDAFPVIKEYLFKIRTKPVGWCGETYISIFNFYINNKNTCYIVNDGHVGYCFIKPNNLNLNLDYDLIDYDLDFIKQFTIEHSDFFALNVPQMII